MKPILTTAALATLVAGAAWAEGDPEAGEAAFRQCQACHVVADDEGNVLAGRAARTGPNLYGIVGDQAGTVEDFRYGNALVEAGEAGLEWNEEDFVAYLLDPQGFLREYLDDSSARSRMTFRIRDEQDARDLYAYLESLEPEM